ncbi:hypothetical protein GCM10023149_36980 [Mucilaginibacter gynuensis]|uniref:SNF2 family DNA or RNA helicase n=1 Tax=Mucilaginibacter gynuensis TaxID=1302236 RepID=A0ABP8GX51_9SPHI
MNTINEDSDTHQAPRHTYVLDKELSVLTEGELLKHSLYIEQASSYSQGIVAVELSVNEGLFGSISKYSQFPEVAIVQQAGRVVLSCGCGLQENTLCEHQVQVLTHIIRKEDVLTFFDPSLRRRKLLEVARAYGLEEAPDLDVYFQLEYTGQRLSAKPKIASLFSSTAESLKTVNELLFNNGQPDLSVADVAGDDTIRAIVLREHKYYKHLIIELYDGAATKEGKIKNPLAAVNILSLLAGNEDLPAMKFLAATAYFQQAIDAKRSATALNHLRAIVKNPMEYAIYAHNAEASEKVTASALGPVQLSRISKNINLSVTPKGEFYEIKGLLKIGDTSYLLKDLTLKFTYFIELQDTLYLVKDLQMLGLIQLFRDKYELLIHHTQYKNFRGQVLGKLEEQMEVNYTHIKPATKSLIERQQIYQNEERIIYLSDFGRHVMIVPVMRYDEVEISIRTTKQIFTSDDKGNEYLVKRDEQAEQDFMAMLIKQHPDFIGQLEDDLQYFYLHKKRFLDAGWFLNAFEEWRNQGITILGFNELSGNRLNAHKAKITVQVISGVNWFNAKINARFGRKKASLKHLHKAIRNKSKFVQLDDGTLGILPDDWIEKFTKYFTSGEVLDDDTLITAKINYEAIAALYDKEMIDEQVVQEIAGYKARLSKLENINEVPVPTGLNATMRQYQHEGLNWLNLLDDLNFGGCLADDMGLGKTLQIIAFVLLQRTKVDKNVNLLIVPTSLVFNWQAEVQRFAPSIKILTLHGAGRVKDAKDFDGYELVLTTYGTLLADVGFLKGYIFNYIFLDESQNIKNPGSQRYKAARLLQARNRIAITGTLIENNTFDLFSQLSFTCPGLLGSKQYFKDIYSSPIDKFKVSKRARELQNKIAPFILRRTKQEVAQELPDKTEMVLYCEMQAEQRKMYLAYEREFREYISATTQEELPASSVHVLRGLTRLRQLCDSPLLLGDEKLPGEESSKIDMLLEQIEMRAPHHKILVFSQFVAMLDLVRKELRSRAIRHAYLTGSTRNREEVVNDFQTNPDTRVFLISLKAGGTGLNLTAADYVYLVDPWWNPAVENQAIDRCYRIGQHKNVVAVRLICPDTIEDKVQKLQESKKELINGLIRSGSFNLQNLSKTDLLSLLDS